jgi:acetyl esterase
MALDPDAQKMLDMSREAGLPPIETLTPEQARAQIRATREKLKQVPPQLPEVRNLAARGPHGSIPMRLYRSRPLSERNTQPVLVYFHGGGWLFGDLDTHDVLCRHLALAADSTVISVDYRLAPEHKFPCAFEDAFAATKWIADKADALGVDRRCIALGGDSAGGNLATTVALMAGLEGNDPPIMYQLLIYPAVDMGFTHDSYRRVGDGYTLTAAGMRWFRDHYLRGPDDIEDWRASPLRAKDLSRLPPAFVVTAGHDPLCDEGEEYARRLAQQGVRVTHRHLPGQMHAFIGLSGWVKAADDVIAEMGAALRKEWMAG